MYKNKIVKLINVVVIASVIGFCAYVDNGEKINYERIEEKKFVDEALKRDYEIKFQEKMRQKKKRLNEQIDTEKGDMSAEMEKLKILKEKNLIQFKGNINEF
ncbi:MAG: hypothetical protein OEZ22_10855 [Spirochaetia bacterium]|nr:hypothetical protein [Spirochaetia bacterium]